MIGSRLSSVVLFTLSLCTCCLPQDDFAETTEFPVNSNEQTETHDYLDPVWVDGTTTSVLPPLYPVKHAGLPIGLAVYPQPLQDTYHELAFNVTWQHSLGQPARDYSIEVRSVTDTVDCSTPMCYEYNIPGESSWWLVPAYSNPVAETCAVRPGCAYSVRLIPHPWDGHTAANTLVELDECVAGVCSCAHSPRLPVPAVSAWTVSIQGEIMVNVTWTTPIPEYPHRLPPELRKQQYVVSIGKQMVSDAHPSPWFANTVTRYVDASGLVSEIDTLKSLLLPINERSERNERLGRRKEKTRHIVLDVRLLARVNLVDDRGCMGPAGNATAYDPLEAKRGTLGSYLLWGIFGGTCVLAICAILAVSAGVVKRILNAFRPAPVSAPLVSIGRRPAWFPLQLRTLYFGKFSSGLHDPFYHRAYRRTAGYHPHLVDLHTAKMWNALPASMFPNVYALNAFKVIIAFLEACSGSRANS